MKSFASDNYAGVLPEVMEALQKANIDHEVSYGSDTITERVTRLFKDSFGSDVEVCFVFNGTGANVLSLSAATKPFSSVLCADTSHIYNDESTAPETYTGCRFVPVQSDSQGKLQVEALEKKIVRKGDLHFAQPSVISLTQSTEYGTVYEPDHIAAISGLAQKHGLYLHIDGSRFFNAAAALGCNLKDLSTDLGVDILSLGGTKLGMMFGEAVVVFNRELARDIRFRQKQSMQLASKTRFIAAQYEVLLQNDYWRKPAIHANNMAQRLAQVISAFSEARITKAVEANAVFTVLPADWVPLLQERYPFYVWDEATGEVRFMCSFDTTEEDIAGLKDSLTTVVKRQGQK